MNNMIVYRGNPREPTTTKKLVCKCSRVTGYKINIQKLVALLHTKHEHVDIKNTVSFMTATKNEIWDLYAEKY